MIFIYTVSVGILNGTDLVDFEGQQGRQVLLAHVHGGTIGWLTLAVFAASLWLFGGGNMSDSQRKLGSWLSYLSAASVVVYILVFLTTMNEVRPAVGAVVTAIFIAFLGWVGMRARRRVDDAPSRHPRCRRDIRRRCRDGCALGHRDCNRQ
ncbi:MAG TPA: hypothetical protein QF624_10980 [Dehalococcoidia bacterium]|nr:hypothetical protein [Dehalococcoidia bacterium]